jgi:hypothetical protein
MARVILVLVILLFGMAACETVRIEPPTLMHDRHGGPPGR